VDGLAGDVPRSGRREERCGPPAGDGSRSVLVKLTAAGHELVERVVDQVLGREALLVQGLRPAERAALVALLDRLLRDVTRQVKRGVSPGTP
jgi:hypothetical protein